MYAGRFIQSFRSAGSFTQHQERVNRSPTSPSSTLNSHHPSVVKAGAPVGGKRKPEEEVDYSRSIKESHLHDVRQRRDHAQHQRPLCQPMLRGTKNGSGVIVGWSSNDSNVGSKPFLMRQKRVPWTGQNRQEAHSVGFALTLLTSGSHRPSRARRNTRCQKSRQRVTKRRAFDQPSLTVRQLVR